MYPDCLKDFVGIAEKGSPCLDSDTSNISTIGLFVDQDPTYNQCRFQSGDTACNLIKLLLRMREEAYRQVTMDIGAVLATKIKTRSEYQYFIGQNEAGNLLSNNLVPANPYLVIKTELRPGAFIEVTKIALMITPINGAVTVDLRLIRESDNQLLYTWTIPVAVRSTTPKPVISYKIPCDGDSYRVEYDYNGLDFYVPLSQYHCGCGDKIKLAAGFIRENVSQTYGISLYVNMYCDAGQVICALLKNSVYRQVIGYMIRMKIIELAIQEIYFRQDVNRFTLMTPEDMTNQIESYRLEYSERLKWLAFQTDFDVDGFCLQCAGNTARKVNLLKGR